MGDNMITNRKYLVYVIVFVLLLIVLTAAGTYAYFKIQITSQSGTVVGMAFDCMDITYSEENTINLEGQYPISDEYALENLTPLTITVTNNCSYNEEPINYILTLTSLSNNVGYIPDNKMRIAVKKQLEGSSVSGNRWSEEVIVKPQSYLNSLTSINSGFVYSQIMGSLSNRNDTNGFTNKNVYQIDYSSINNGESFVYKVYVWIDYYEGDTTHTGLNDNSTEGFDFVATTNIIANPAITLPEYNIVQNDSNYTVSVLNAITNTPTIKSTAKEGEMVILESTNPQTYYKVLSFDLNGETIEGDSFIMPGSNVTITNIVYGKYRFDIDGSSRFTEYRIKRQIIDDSDAYGIDPGTVVEIRKNHFHSTGISQYVGVQSFRLNGELIQGNTFIMPNEDVTITDVSFGNFYVFESTFHGDDGNGRAAFYTGSNVFENTFTDATSITVELTYQTWTERVSGGYYDVYLRIYAPNSSTTFGTYKNTTKTTEVLTIPGNYINIYWYIPGSTGSVTLRDEYGFKAIITPNYD